MSFFTLLKRFLSSELFLLSRYCKKIILYGFKSSKKAPGPKNRKSLSYAASFHLFIRHLDIQKQSGCMAALTLMFFLSSCGTDGGPDSIFQSGGFSGGGGGSVGLTSSGASVSPGSPSFCPGSDPSDNIPVDIPQKNGNTWVMAKTRLGTITKYNMGLTPNKTLSRWI